MVNWAIFVLRIAVGGLFLLHGSQELFGVFGGIGQAGFTDYLTAMGFWPGAFWAYLTASIELIAGLFLILGLFNRVALLALFILLKIAVIKVLWVKGFVIPIEEYQFKFIFDGVLIALILLGPGEFRIKKTK